MKVQFGARLVAQNTQEFKRILSNLPGPAMPHQQCGPGWFTTDFFGDLDEIRFPRYILTNEGLPHARAFWNTVLCGREQDFYERARQIRADFEADRYTPQKIRWLAYGLPSAQRWIKCWVDDRQQQVKCWRENLHARLKGKRARWTSVDAEALRQYLEECKQNSDCY